MNDEQTANIDSITEAENDQRSVVEWGNELQYNPANEICSLETALAVCQRYESALRQSANTCLFKSNWNNIGSVSQNGIQWAKAF